MARKARVELENGSSEHRGLQVSIPEESEIRQIAASLHAARIEHSEANRDWEVKYELAIPEEGLPDWFVIQSVFKQPSEWPLNSVERLSLPPLGVWWVVMHWESADDQDPGYSEFFHNLIFPFGEAETGSLAQDDSGSGGDFSEALDYPKSLESVP